LPDGEFLQELVEQFLKTGGGYLGTHSPLDGLPYGVSAEVFKVSLIRQADREAVCASDREHVTPWMRRQTKAPRFLSRLSANYSYLRATVDTFEDYQRILRLFAEESDPVGVSWLGLIQRLSADCSASFRVPYKLKNNRVLSRLTLGTAQLGVPDYGIANQGGRPTEALASNLILRAVSHGVTDVDTGRAYGCAEERVGSAFARASNDTVRIITKLDPLMWLEPSCGNDAIRAAVECSVYRSCHCLRRQSLDVVLLHRADLFHWAEGAVWKLLLECRDRGLIRELGVSVYSPTEALTVLRSQDVLHLQVPLNVLDRRWEEAGVPQALVSRPDVTVYGRSAFLQGALLLPAAQWPEVAQPGAAIWCQQLDGLVDEFQRQDRADLALAYVQAQPWVDSVVLGMESIAQLDANLQAICRSPLTFNQARAVETIFCDVPESVLNPTQWEARK